MISAKEIDSLTKRWDIDRTTILREYIQLLFLSHLYKIKDTDSIFFKGGTAIRFLYGSFRFSEDLDFTSIINPEQTITFFKRAILNLTQEIPDTKMEDFKTNKYSIVSRIKYKSKDETYPIGIHIEIFLREKPLTRQTSSIETLFPISPYPIITHLDGEEMLSEKIRALSRREKGRDLFDIWFLISKEVRLNWDMVQKKMEFYKETVTSKGLISKIQVFDQKELYQDLAKFLPRHQRKIISGLKDNVIKKLEEANRG